MRKPDVTDEQVIELAYELQRLKKKVTGHALSSVLGGRPDRLIKIWENHLTSGDNRNTALPDVMLSPELQDTFDSISKDILASIRSVLAKCEKSILERTAKQIESEKILSSERFSALQEQLNHADAIINKNQDDIDSLIIAKQELEEKHEHAIELEKLLIETKTRLEGCMSSIQDKERIIAEQGARIDAFVISETRQL